MVTGSGESLINTARFADETTVVATETVLSLVSKSGPLARTVAVFVNEPVPEGLRTILAVACVPSLSIPKLQMTVLLERPQEPWLAVAETKLAPAGSGLTMRTPPSPAGPLVRNSRLLVTVKL